MNRFATPSLAVALVTLICPAAVAAPIAVTSATFDNALSGGRFVANTEYNLTSLTAGGTQYDTIVGSTASGVASDTFIFGNFSDNTGGQYTDTQANRNASVTGTNFSFGLGNIDAGVFQFDAPLSTYEGFAFFELQGQETLSLELIDASNTTIGTYTLTTSSYGSDVALAPTGGFYRPGNGGQFSSTTGPVGVFFDLSDFEDASDIQAGSLTTPTATGFRITGELDAIDPFALVAVNPIPEPASVLLLTTGLGLILARRRQA